jgi:hypothetical protein
MCPEHAFGTVSNVMRQVIRVSGYCLANHTGYVAAVRVFQTPDDPYKATIGSVCVPTSSNLPRTNPSLSENFLVQPYPRYQYEECWKNTSSGDEKEQDGDGTSDVGI